MNKRNVILVCVFSAIACIALIVIAVVFIDRYSFVNDGTEQIVKERRVEASVTEQPIQTPLVTSMPDVISGKTKYMVQTYYVNTDSENKITEDEMPIPADIIAMDRQELEDYLKKYIDEMPLNEYLDGLLSYEIISFSGDKVVLRKTYASDWSENDYYVCDINGEVVVCYGDKKTVYEYTGIRTEDLSDNEQIKVKIGYFVANEEELYALLESYSS